MKQCHMNFNDEQLKQVEEMSGALLPPADIAILLNLSPEDRDMFCEVVKTHINSAIFMAFHKGRLNTKFELRKTIIKLAKHGSPAAEPIAEKFITEQML